MAYIEIADMPVIDAPTDLRQRSRWRFQQNGWGDAWGQGFDNFKPGLSYTGMYPISHERMSDGETPGYRGAGMGQLDVFAGALGKAANRAVDEVILKTTATGAISIRKPFEPGQPPQTTVEGGNMITKKIAEFFQPAIYVRTKIGTFPFEPYGTPVADHSAIIAGLVVLGAATMIVGGLYAAKKVLS